MSTPRPLRRAMWLAALLTAMLAMPCHDALAQSGSRTRSAATTPRTTTENVPNALQGFSQNRDQPIHIEAETLEVHDKQQVATFTGNVHVVQGDTDLRCDKLVVYYEQAADKTAKSASASRTAPPQQSTPEGQRIRRLEIKGNVVVTQKDQIATGDSGNFDMRSNIVTLVGNVIVSQGKNVLRGDRLVVNMTSGVSRMESKSGRVQGLFQPSEQQDSARPGGPGGPGFLPRLN